MTPTPHATHLILIADGIPTPSGAGISQTLANLLDAYPGAITCVCTEDEQVDVYEDRLPTCIERYDTGPWRSWSNRFGLWLNPYFLRKQLQWIMRQPLELGDLPKPATALVVVSTNVPHKLLYAWRLLQKGYTVVPYFMDDWVANNTVQWRYAGDKYSIQKLVKDLLVAAPKWLMISEELQATLIKRYQLQPKPCLVVHNPAPETVDSKQMTDDRKEVVDRKAVSTEGAIRQPSTVNCQLIIYAGSIWPMHADALIPVAKAIHLLQRQGKTAYQLQLYVNPAHWAQYQRELSGPGVSFMGWKPYREVQQYLQQGWLLLCTASFEEAHQHFSRSSVQTKLTDYMAARKPLLFVGPPESASGRFVENWDCGFTISTANPADIAERLQAISRMPEQYLRKSINSGIEAETTFSKPVVQQKLYDFLGKD